jgi:hypothetical protein
MKRMEDKETAGLKFCHACNVEARNVTDRFCRRCGARHIHDTDRFYNDPPDSPITPHMDQISETVAPPQTQDAPADVTFEKMGRQLFSLLGAES